MPKKLVLFIIIAAVAGGLYYQNTQVTPKTNTEVTGKKASNKLPKHGWPYLNQKERYTLLIGKELNTKTPEERKKAAKEIQAAFKALTPNEKKALHQKADAFWKALPKKIRMKRVKKKNAQKKPAK